MKTLYKKIVNSFLSLIFIFSFQLKLSSQSGAALNFDGLDDHVTIPSFNFGATWTAEAWIRPTSLFGNWKAVMGQCFYNLNQGFVIAVQNGSVFIDIPFYGAISTPVSPNIWTHVALTYNNGIYAFYKDGILIGNKTAPFSNSSNPFYLGIRSNNNNVGLIDPFQGDIDEVRIWNITRSQCEIQDYMNCEIPSSATGLMANYHFNQGVAGSTLLNLFITTLSDATGNAHHGTLSSSFDLGSLLGGSVSNWIAPGAVPSNFSTPTSSSPEINVRGNGVNIVDGDMTPSSTDHTDFGTTLTRTFVIESIGTSTLNVGVPVFTGPNAGEFTVTVAPGPTLAAISASTSFVVAFTPTSLGVKTATLNLYNSDCSEPVYRFAVTASATAASALHFDGLNDYIETGANLAELGQGDFTIEAWIKTTSTGMGIVTCLDSDSDWTSGEKAFYINPSGYPSFVGWGNNYITSTYTVNDGNWHHVAVVWDYYNGTSGGGKMYIDGVDRTGIVSYAANHNNIGTFKIGQTNYNASEAPNNFNGEIDEVRIWNRVLCLPEIIHNMNCELPNPTTQPGLMGYYQFNSGISGGLNSSVTSVADAALSANTGTLFNFSLSGLNSNWISPGAVSSGSACAVYLYPEINITGNGITIVHRDVIASLTDYTSFGQVFQGSVLSRTFVIQNTGTDLLNITSYNISGADAGSFTITSNPAPSVVSGGSTNIVVSFLAAIPGTRSATLTVNNNDCDEAGYFFAINAVGVPPAAALDFDGINDVVQISDPVFGTGDFTMEGWLKPSTTNTTGGFIISSRFNEGFQAGFWWTLRCGPDGGAGRLIGIEMAESGGGHVAYQNFNSTNLLSSGVWNHFAIVRQGLKISIYINGNLSNTFNEVISHNLNNGYNNLNIGGWAQNNTSWYSGAMDELRLWTVARTQCEIQSYMNCEIPGSAPGLAGNYHFNQGVAGLPNPGITSLIDASASARTGTLSGFGLSAGTSNWIAPGGVVSNYTTAANPLVEIDVQGNGNSITNGNTSSSTLDYTDFNGVLTRTFVIHNIVSGGTLNIGTPYLSGTNAGDFSLTTLPATSVNGIGSTSFVLAFTPSTLGAKAATVNIINNDCNEPVFNFAITATATTASALNFNGNNNRIIVSPGISLNNQSFTIEFWAKRTSTLSGYVMGQGSTVNPNQALHIGFRPGNVFTFAFYDNDINYTTPATSDGNYHHWACVYNPTASGHNRFVYLDGVLIASDYSSSAFLGTGNFIIGDAGYYGSYPNPLNGTIDELRVWGVARTQCDIQTYMNCEIPTTATGLLANYHFNQGLPAGANSTVTTAIDATGNHNGTLTNFSLTGSSSNWVSPGGVTTGSIIPASPTASILVSGNSNSITPGTTVTSTLNFTDFGNLTTRTFVIQNSNIGTLNISAPYFTGLNASEFSVTTLPSLSLAASATTSFVVAFSPTITGFRTATLNINNNDCNIPIFNCAIGGTPVTASALNFDGTNNHVKTTIPVSSFSAGLITVESWIMAEPGGTFNSIIKNWGNPSIGAFHFGLNLTGTNLEIHLTQSNSSIITLEDPDPIGYGVWHHVAFVADGLRLRLYKNGIEVANTTYNGTIKTDFLPVFIGAKPNNSGSAPEPIAPGYWRGGIDELRVWNTARTQCQIQSFMNCEIPTNASSLIVNYHFNQGIPHGSNATYTTLTDAAGIYTGTLSGFALTGSVSNWVSPGGVVSGYTTAVVPTSSLVILGNGIIIPAGSTTTGTNNFTDFGTAHTRTFVLQNPGTGTLYVNNSVLSGAQASEFSINTSPSSTIGTGASNNLVISFNPVSVGTKSAVLTVYSSDCTAPNYSFVISATSVPGEALHFDGVNDVVDCGTSPNLDITTGTWEAWVKLSSLTSNSRIFFKDEADGLGTGTYESYYLAGTSKFHAGIKIGGTSYTVASVTSPLADTWYHVAVTYDAKGLKMHINGTLENVNTNPTGAMNPGTGHLSIGGSYANPTFSVMNGAIDEVRLWNRARCQDEIQAQMNCELSGNETGLILYYQFSEGTANGVNTIITFINDIAGADNNGTLSNFSLSGSASNWTAPGAVTTGSLCTPYTAPEIQVSANALPIVSGTTVTSLANNTDFGNISTNGFSTQTYTIENTGSAPLSISSISITGADATSFTISPLSPSSPVTASSSAVFSVTFAPVSAGTKTAVIHILNDDCHEPDYQFAISGSADPGAALNFDGTDDYINCGTILTASYTKEAWVRIGTSLNGNNLISAGSGVSGSAFWAPGIYNYSLSAGHNGDWNQVQDNAPLTQGTWYHVAVTYDAPSTTMKLYKNGILVSSSNTVPAFSGTHPLHIGAFAGTFVTTGSMDEVRIWNRALCQSEIQNNMHCEIPSTAAGLIANYHFNQGVGFGANATHTLLTDASAAANTGTLINFAATGTLSNWVATSTVTSGSTCTPVFVPEINIVGNGQSIIAGDNTPSPADDTDFGSICINSQVVHTYSIQNTGTSNLAISGLSVSGTHASMFSAGAVSPSTLISPGNTGVFSVTFSPTSSGTMSADIVIANNDCDEDPYVFAITGICHNLPVVSAAASNSVLCDGDGTTLNGSGADTYTWTGGSQTITDGIAFIPSLTLTYTVSGTNTLTGCTSTNVAIQTITVNPNPSVSVTANPAVICEGNSITITPSGALSYTLEPGTLSGTGFTLSPSTNTSYSLTGTSSDGCVSSNTAIITVTVNPLPVVTASASSPAVCETQTTSLIGGGADTYTWSGSVTNELAFTPSITDTYTVTGTNTLTGCTSTNLAVQTITVNIIPTVSVTASGTVICDGETAVLTADGANTYTWYPGSFTGNTLAVNPNTSTTYTVEGISTAGCSNTNLAVQTISVNSVPTVSATISDAVICSGIQVTVQASGALTYTWSGDVTDGVAFQPATSASYSVTGTNSAGCTSTNQAVVSVTVNELPQVSSNISNSVICIGGQSTLSGNGALTYTWSGGISNNVAFSPSLTSSYTLTGTDVNGCINQTVATITVNNLPQLSISGSPSVSCEAQTTTLTVTGASTYTWSSGQNTSSIVITPATTTSFTVSGLDLNGCENISSYTHTVIICPEIFTATVSTKNISCNGKNDGEIHVDYTNTYSNSAVSFNWNPSTLCHDDTCDSLKNLPSGIYYLTLKVTYTLNNSLVKTDSIVLDPITLLDERGDCAIKVFNGVSANGDGINDIMVIENIEQFPGNKVWVYNRWGQLVFETNGYNNTDRAWPAKGEENNLVANTYFYIIDLGNASKPIKGWVELIKN